MTPDEQDIARRAAHIGEIMLRHGSFPNMEAMIAMMILYMRSMKALGLMTTEQEHAECHSLLRTAHDRYLTERREKLYGPSLEQMILQ